MSALAPALPDARVLDLFSGSGALGLECLSRGASHVVFVELAREPLAAVRDNVRALGAESRVEIVRGDAQAFVKGLEPLAFDLALADPPYERGMAEALLRAFLSRPFARELWVEHRKGEAIPEDPRLRQRRYGDTTLTVAEALPDDG